MAFRLKCLVDLYKDLGQYDAIVEFTEVSIREFIHQSSSSKSFQEFIESKSSQHGIKLNSVNGDSFRSRISCGYILSTYQRTELFFEDFRNQYKELFNSSWEIQRDLGVPLGAILSLMSKSKANEVIGRHRLELLEYYRFIRNKYNHAKISSNKVDKEFTDLNKQIKVIKEYYPNLNAPNKYDQINFDDFILFTRVVKDVAESLNTFILPSNEILSNYYKNLNLFRQLNTNPSRKANALKMHMREQYGISSEQSEEILRLIYASLV